MIPAIAAGVAVVVVFAGLFVLVLVVFAILFKRQKQNLKYSTSQKDLESQVHITYNFIYTYSMYVIAD